MKKIKKIITGIGISIGTIYLINKYINLSATEKKFTKNNYDKTFKWRNINICYNVKGSGSSILLIHDIDPSTSSYEWIKLQERLSEEYKVYTIDLPGCGKSDKPNITYVCYYYVDLIHCFINEIIKENTTVITSGSALAPTVMCDGIYPNDIRKIIGINPPSVNEYYKVPSLGSRTIKLLLDFPILGNTVYNFLNSKNSIKIKLKTSYYKRDNNILSVDADYIYESAHLSDGNGRFLQASIYGKHINSYILDTLKNSITPIAFIYTPENKYFVKSYVKYTNRIQMLKTDGREKPHMEYPNTIMETLRVCLPFEGTYQA